VRRTRLAGGASLGIAAVALISIATALIFAGTVNGLSFWDFTLDDAYITYRYSDHLAGGAGPVWNVGENPVEGYTSFLWMLIAAAGIGLGADADTWAKVLSLLCAVALVLIMAIYGRDRLPLARLVAIAGLTLSPAFLVIVVQGMETALAALLATALGVLLIEVVRRPTWMRLIAYFVVALLALLTRPDLVPYVAMTVAGLAVALVRSGERGDLRRAAASAGALLFPGALYMAWRWSYYGYPLPNTFYIKRGSGFIDSLGVTFVREFTLEVALPYLLLAGALFVRAAVGWRRSGRPSGGELIAVGAVFIGAVAFLAAGALVNPLQGHLWRFQMPIYPVLLLVVVVLSRRSDWSLLRRRSAARAVAVVGTLALVVFPLHTLDEARYLTAARWQHDRAVAGQALHGLSDLGASMLVTEAGALPFYSGWRATDLLGLNDEEIAHGGLRPSYLRRLAPDLVVFASHLTGGPPARAEGYYTKLRELVRGGAYRFADAYRKTDERLRPVEGFVHVYLVRVQSPHADRIARRLRALTGVRRLSVGEVRPILDGFGVKASEANQLRTAG